MRLALALDPSHASHPPVTFRWDADTDILTAEFAAHDVGPGMTGSVEIEGPDGSWIVLDVRNGGIASIEVAVWPDVKIVDGLAPPAEVVGGVVTVPSRPSQPGVTAVEVNTRVIAEADTSERTVHFRIGAARPSRPVGVADNILLELDDALQIAGIWMLNVPPFPGES